MTFEEFNRLNDEQKGKTLVKMGVYLSERYCMALRIALYQIENFYVEVYFNSAYKVVQGFKPFVDIDALDPYLNSIDIKELMSACL